MSSGEEDVLEQIASDYNDLWDLRRDNVCWNVSQLKSFLEELTVAARQVAFWELCHIELRRDWTWWLKEVRDHYEVMKVEDVLQGLETRATASQLIQVAKDFQIAIYGTEEALRVEEYSTRMEIGDAAIPSIQDARFMPNLPPSKKYFSVRRLPASERIIFPLYGKTTFGRQKDSEEAKGAMLYREDTNRYVFTDRLDKRFSREQFSVRIVNKDFAIVSNLSHNNPLDAGPNMFLTPQASGLAKFPFQVNILEFEMTFFSF